MGEEPSTGDGAGTSTAQNGVERPTNVTIATGSETHDIDVEEALTLLIKNTFEDSSPHPPQNNETGGELSDVAPKTPTKPIPSRVHLESDEEDQTTPTIPDAVTTPSKSSQQPQDEMSGTAQPKENGSPTKPAPPSSPAKPEAKKYRILYGELKKRYLAQQQTIIQLENEQHVMNGKLSKYAAESDKWREKHEKLQEEMEEMKNNYEKIIVEKDELLQKKNATTGQDTVCYGLHAIAGDEDIIRLKPKAKKKGSSAEEKLKCKYHGCGKENVDLIQCNMCSTWVCEDCNDVPVARLKPIINKCNTIHFLCKTCEDKIGEKLTDHEEVLSQSPGNQNEILSSLKSMLDNKVTQMESKIEKAIEKKLEDKMAAITRLDDKIKDSGVDGNDGEKVSYAKVLQLPEEVRRVMQETRNDEKIEKNEQEKRTQNFIIHGAEEIGSSAEEVKKNDDQYLKDILKRLGVKATAESVTRLGQPNDRKMRTLKIIMKTEKDKEEVMANLRKLKGTEEEFGKISVTPDYSSTEREKIREYAAKAKAQGEQDPTRVYKVRGDPKNGLRVISFEKK